MVIVGMNSTMIQGTIWLSWSRLARFVEKNEWTKKCEPRGEHYEQAQKHVACGVAEVANEVAFQHGVGRSLCVSASGSTTIAKRSARKKPSIKKSHKSWPSMLQSSAMS